MEGEGGGRRGRRLRSPRPSASTMATNNTWQQTIIDKRQTRLNTQTTNNNQHQKHYTTTINKQQQSTCTTAIATTTSYDDYQDHDCHPSSSLLTCVSLSVSSHSIKFGFMCVVSGLGPSLSSSSSSSVSQLQLRILTCRVSRFACVLLLLVLIWGCGWDSKGNGNLRPLLTSTPQVPPPLNLFSWHKGQMKACAPPLKCLGAARRPGGLDAAMPCMWEMRFVSVGSCV